MTPKPIVAADRAAINEAIARYLEPMPSTEGVSNNATLSPLGFWRSATQSQYAPWEWYWIPRYDYFTDESANARLLDFLIERDRKREPGTSWIVPTLMDKLCSPWSEMEDRKTAILLAFLKFAKLEPRHEA